jgi:hypothetical protein
MKGSSRDPSGFQGSHEAPQYHQSQHSGEEIGSCGLQQEIQLAIAPLDLNVKPFFLCYFSQKCNV